MYLTYIRLILEYACTAWGNLGTTQVDRLERFQRRAAKNILHRPLSVPSNHDELLATIGWPSLASRRKYFQAVLGHRMATGNVPQHLRDYIPFFQLPTTNTSLMLNSPLDQAADTSTPFLQFFSLPQVSHPLKTVLHYSYSHANVHAVSIYRDDICLSPLSMAEGV